MQGPIRILLAILPVIVGCTSTPLVGRGEQPGQPQTSAAPQRPVVISMNEEPLTFEPSFGSGGISRDYNGLTSAFLAYLTPEQQPLPYLADELPTLEKGTWIMLPDGRMETTYRLNPRAAWHDGQPVTAHDFVFASQMHLDPALPTTRIDVDRRMSSVRALDDRTLVIQWKEPYVWAGMIFSPNFPALPRHLLEEMYQADKTAFVNGPHWTREFVGTGPYKIERWEQGVEMTLRAHDGFVLGKPRVEVIVLKFIPEGNTIVANLLGGAIDVGIYSGLGFAHGKALEEARWPGTVEYWRGIADYLDFQLRDWGNLQRAVLDVRVRRALMHAVDRQSIVDGLYGGTATVHHFWLTPDDPAFPAVDRAVHKYEYDVGRAAALLREAGWARGSDGLLRDGTGEVLSVPLVSQFTEIEQKQATVVVDNWKTLGIPPEVKVMTAAQQRDRETRAKIANAVGHNNRSIRYDSMAWTSSQIPTAENGWRGNNYTGYVNPVLDELWPKVLATPDPKEREAVLVEALRSMTADAAVNVTNLQPKPVAFRAGLVGPRQPWSEDALLWNSWEWHWRS